MANRRSSLQPIPRNHRSIEDLFSFGDNFSGSAPSENSNNMENRNSLRKSVSTNNVANLFQNKSNMRKSVSGNNIFELFNSGIEGSVNAILNDIDNSDKNTNNNNYNLDKVNEQLNAATISGIGGAQMQLEVSKER